MTARQEIQKNDFFSWHFLPFIINKKNLSKCTIDTDVQITTINYLHENKISYWIK